SSSNGPKRKSAAPLCIEAGRSSDANGFAPVMMRGLHENGGAMAISVQDALITRCEGAITRCDGAVGASEGAISDRDGAITVAGGAIGEGGGAIISRSPFSKVDHPRS